MMDTNTPILWARLTKKGRELFDTLGKAYNFNGNLLRVTKDQYDELLKGVPEHQRISLYSDKIPFGNKYIMRV